MSVAAVDNHRSVLDGIRWAVERAPDLRLDQVVADLGSLDLGAPAPTVVVLDLYLGRDDVPATPAIPDLVDWGALVLLYTSSEYPVPLRRAVAAGACGLSLKNDGESALVDAIRAVAAGEFACSSTLAAALLHDRDLVARLSPREVEVIRDIGDGLTRQQVASRYHIVLATVSDHIKSVRRKYLEAGRDVSNAISLVREARRDGWID